MNFAISFLAVAIFIHMGDAAMAKRFLYQMSAAVFDDEIEAFLEDIKPTLKTGNESLGIPRLEPYQMEFYNLSTTYGETSVDGDISDVNIVGLSDYTVNTAKFRYGHLQVKLNLTWPNVTLNSLYRINTDINKWGYFPIYGKGDIKLKATNLTITATMKMGLKSGKILVREMDTSFHVGDVSFVASGIYDSKGVSEVANAIVSSQLPYVIEKCQGLISARLNPELVSLMNRHLAELTFDDFLNIVAG